MSEVPENAVIMCVEDEDVLRRDIADELVEAGYKVIEAGNGELALEMLRRTRPDLILCDISMPGLNGYEVLDAVQAKGPEAASIPFVFLSALGDPREVVEGKRRGADDYLVKPIDYDLLLATVEARLRQIGRIRQAQARDKGPAPGAETVGAGVIDAGMIATTFRLTPAEARIAQALAQGHPPAEIADDFGISRTTVAFHMRNIFQKTDTRRQAELVSLLLRTLAREAVPIPDQ